MKKGGEGGGRGDYHLTHKANGKHQSNKGEGTTLSTLNEKHKIRGWECEATRFRRNSHKCETISVKQDVEV
jgi:hypothetical protein